jgi:membrane protease YdiL (CAAX protease family)
VVAEGYLRLARDRVWWKLLLELVLALVWWLIAAGVVAIVILEAAGAKKLEELDILTQLVLIHLTLGSMTIAALAGARVMGRNPWQILSVAGRLRWSWLGRCVAIALIAQLSFVVLGMVLELVTTGTLESLSHGDSQLGYVVVITLVLVPFQAGAEEVFNRGTLQQVLGGWGAPAWLAMLLTTGAFIAMHGTPNLGTIAIAAMGFTYAWLTLETGGLEAAIAGHAINNIVAFILGALAHGTDALDPQKLNERVDVTSLVVQLASIAIYTSLVLRSWRRSTRTAAV